MPNLSKIVLVLAGLFSATISVAQVGFSEQITRQPDRSTTLQGMEDAADKAFRAGDYATAMYRYKKVLEQDSLRATALYGLGEAAMAASAFEVASEAFRKLSFNRLAVAGKRSALLRLGDALFQMGQYDAAKYNYQRYLTEENQISPELQEELLDVLANCDWALQRGKSPNLPLATPFIALDTPAINTTYSEYSPIFDGENLYFSSYRFPFEKDKNYPKRRLIKVMEYDIKAPESAPQLVGIGSPDRHTAHVSFNEKRDRLYYCDCAFISTVGIKCSILRRKLDATGNWGPAELLPTQVNPKEFTNTEPAIGRAPESDLEVLYFVSDRPGGVGKRDIWYTYLFGDSLGAAINLKGINTPEDDVTPFYHNQAGALYFSTDGRPSMGGLDVYRSLGSPSSGWAEPEHLSAPAEFNTPVNSGYNDVFFSVSPDGLSVFLSSNRRGDFNTSEEACCYDLFKADLVAPKMLVVTLHKATLDSLTQTRLRLVEIKPDGTATPEKLFFCQGNQLPLELQPGKKYRLISDKDYFSNDTLYFETPRVMWKHTFVQNVYLQPAKVTLALTVVDKMTEQPIKQTTARFYNYSDKPGNPLQSLTRTEPLSHSFQYNLDFNNLYRVSVSKPGYSTDSTDLVSTLGIRKDTLIQRVLRITRGVTFKAHTLDYATMDSLDGVQYTLVDLSSGLKNTAPPQPKVTHYQAVVDYEKRYRIIASKEGYTSDTLDFTTLNLPKLEFQQVIRTLKIRSLDLARYLPIRLYFDNDEPGNKTMARTTNLDYQQTFKEYMNQEEDYAREFSRGLRGDKKQLAVDSINSFFENEVRKGWNSLFTFTEVLDKILSNGDTVIITLKGYASPRARPEYNLNLTDRRVSAVENHFTKFETGYYNKFIKAKLLIIEREANGESKAPKNVSDDIRDRRRSVYDVSASRQRRVEIVGVKSNISTTVIR
jgi:tetratricopeptide (TPR) repeat protein